MKKNTILLTIVFYILLALIIKTIEVSKGFVFNPENSDPGIYISFVTFSTLGPFSILTFEGVLQNFAGFIGMSIVPLTCAYKIRFSQYSSVQKVLFGTLGGIFWMGESSILFWGTFGG